MSYDPELREKLGRFPQLQWRGTAYRHMFGLYPPERENTRGARWNPPQIAAIYASLDKRTALAEAEYQISLQPKPPTARRVMYSIRVALEAVLDLSSIEALQQLGITRAELQAVDYRKCQQVGGAVEWLDHDGLLVPSARGTGTNLVIYPNRIRGTYLFEVESSEEIQ